MGTQGTHRLHISSCGLSDKYMSVLARGATLQLQCLQPSTENDGYIRHQPERDRELQKN
jgi:hypothetical protein